MNRMLQPSDRPARCAGPVSRRSLLTAGAAAFTGLGLADLLRLQARASEASGGSALGGVPSGDDPAVIFIWMPGGPPHMETFDMKPEAPEDYRGAFRPIKTNVPGIEICEHLPLLAKRADRYALIRSISHEYADHGGGHKRLMTGRQPKEPTGTNNEHPAVGSIVAKTRERRNVGVPNYVQIVDAGRAQIDTFAMGHAYLGPAYTPFTVDGDPSDSGFKVQNLGLAREMEERLDDRASLLGGLDRLRRNIDKTGAAAAMDSFNQRAIDLLTSEKARAAFDLSKEDPKLREAYGDHPWGQRAIMARRLVEAGVSFATVVIENPFCKQVPWIKNGVYNWDSHAVNCHLFDDALVRLPIFDRTISALIDDIYARGLDKRVMVVVTGEFGRTPRITSQIGTQTGVMQPGRDHWPGAMSVLVFGGGLRSGRVVGATSTKGEYPVDRPLTPNDLWATVFRHLRIDYSASFPDLHGRPMPILPFGEPIRELV